MMKVARIGAVVLAGSLVMFVAGCCCGGGAGRHSGLAPSRDPAAERGPQGSPTVARQFREIDDAYRGRQIGRDEHETARRRILAGPGGVSRL